MLLAPTIQLLITIFDAAHDRAFIIMAVPYDRRRQEWQLSSQDTIKFHHNLGFICCSLFFLILLGHSWPHKNEGCCCSQKTSPRDLLARAHTTWSFLTVLVLWYANLPLRPAHTLTSSYFNSLLPELLAALFGQTEERGPAKKREGDLKMRGSMW